MSGHNHDHTGHDHARHDHAGHDHDHAGHDHAGHDHAGHDHQHGGLSQHGDAGLRALTIALVVIGGYMVVELVVGLWSDSLALVSDAGHMLSDMLALSVAIVGVVMRGRPRTAVATFGHARVAVLGGFVNGALALAVSAIIVKEAVERFSAPPDVVGLPVLITAALGLIVNVGGALTLHGTGDHSLNMRGAMLHMVGDALASVAAIIAGAVLVAGGPAVVDVIVSVAVAVIIAAGAIPLMRDAAHILLERAPPHVDVDAVRATLCAHGAVQGVTSVHVWGLSDGVVAASFVLATDGADLGALTHAADELRRALRDKHAVTHAVIEWRPSASAQPCCDDERR
jgi:cobalt-zinc-cadmium efflux system protein